MAEITRKNKLNLIRHDMLAAAMGGVLYNKWSDAFARNHIKDMISNLRKDLGLVSLSNLTEEEADAAGFGMWSESTPKLRLIPIWFYPFLTPGEKLICIDGKEVTFGEDVVDDDHRQGYLAYGVNIIA